MSVFQFVGRFLYHFRRERQQATFIQRAFEIRDAKPQKKGLALHVSNFLGGAAYIGWILFIGMLLLTGLYNLISKLGLT